MLRFLLVKNLIFPAFSKKKQIGKIEIYLFIPSNELQKLSIFIRLTDMSLVLSLITIDRYEISLFWDLGLKTRRKEGLKSSKYIQTSFF